MIPNPEVRPIWEFQNLKDPNVDPKMVGLLLQGHRKGTPQFMETAMKFSEGSAPNWPYINHKIL